MPTWRLVSRSKTFACMCENLTGKKLLLVSTCRDAKAGNEKLATVGAKMVGTAVAHDPVAFCKGSEVSKAKLGTRGRVSAITIATLLKTEKVNTAH